MRLVLAALVAFALPAGAQEHQHGSTASDEGSKVPAHQTHPLDASSPKPRGQNVSLKVAGKTAKAYTAKPKGEIKGAILVLHEWWGLNDWVKHQADELANLGYLALAVDLYKGKVASDPQTAQKLMGSKDEKWGDEVEEAGLEWLHKNASGKKVATIGWCMGGGESLNSTLHDPKDVDATIMYYGMPVTDVAKLKTMKGPILGIWANQDGWITPDKVKQFDQALTEAGIQHEFHAYDADHAFANPSGGKYNPPAAKDAWAKTKDFLAKNLG
ncbi:MAG: dienelactone hydrolase family protein [Myxococcales bacterium]